MYQCECNTLFIGKCKFNTERERICEGMNFTKKNRRNGNNLAEEYQKNPSPSCCRDEYSYLTKPEIFYKDDENGLCDGIISYYSKNVNVSSDADVSRMKCSHAFICLPKSQCKKNGNANNIQPRCFKCKKICPPNECDYFNETFAYHSQISNNNHNIAMSTLNNNSRLIIQPENKVFKKRNGFNKEENDNTYKECSSSNLCCGTPYSNYKKNVQNFINICCFGGNSNDFRDKHIKNNLESIKFQMKNKPPCRFNNRILYCRNNSALEYCPYDKDIGCKNGKIGCVPIVPDEGPVLSDKKKNKKCFKEIIGTPCNSSSIILKSDLLDDHHSKQNEITAESGNDVSHSQNRNYRNYHCEMNENSCFKRSGKCKTTNCGSNEKTKPFTGDNPDLHLTKQNFWQYSDKSSQNKIPFGLKLIEGCTCCRSCGCNCKDKVELWKRIDGKEKNYNGVNSKGYSNRLSHKLSNLLIRKYDEFCTAVVRSISKQFTFTPANDKISNTCKCCTCCSEALCCKKPNKNLQPKTNGGECDCCSEALCCKKPDNNLQPRTDGVTCNCCNDASCSKKPDNNLQPRTDGVKCDCCSEALCCKKPDNNLQPRTDGEKCDCCGSQVDFENVKNEPFYLRILKYLPINIANNHTSEEQVETERINTSSSTDKKRFSKDPVQITCDKCIVKLVKNNRFDEYEDLLSYQSDNDIIFPVLSNAIFPDSELRNQNKSDELKTKISSSFCECVEDKLKRNVSDASSEDDFKHHKNKRDVACGSSLLYPQLPEISDLESETNGKKDEVQVACICKSPDACICKSSLKNVPSNSSSDLLDEYSKSNYEGPQKQSPFWKRHFGYKK